MANTIKIKAGSGTPTTSNIADRELAFDRSANKLYINDAGTIVELTPDSSSADITSVVAGTGLTGGANSGAATLNIGAGTGIDVAADAISVDVSDFMSNGANNRILTATGTDAMAAESRLTFDGSHYLEVNSVDDAEGGLRFSKSATDATHTKYHISHRDDNQTLLFYSYDGTTYRNWITLDEPNALLKLGSNTSALSQFDNDGDFFPFRHIDMGDGDRIKLGDSDDLQIVHDSNINFIHSTISDRDIYFRVNDGGSSVDAIIIDASDNARVRLANDNQKLSIGASDDLQFYHNGTNSFVQNETGNLYIRNNHNDGQIIFQTDDGSGGYTTYFNIKGNDGISRFLRNVRANDNIQFQVGSSNDANFKHDGTNTYLINNTGDLIISNAANDKDVILKSDDGSGGTTAYLTLDGSATNLNFHNKALVAIGGIYGNSGTLNMYNDTYYFKNASSGIIMSLNGHTLDLPNTGDWSYIKNGTTSGGLRFGTNDGSGNYANQIEISNAGNYVKLNENTTVTGQLTATTTIHSNQGFTTDYGIRFNNGATDFMFYNNTNDNLFYLRDLTNSQMLQTWTTSSTTIHKPLYVTGNLQAGSTSNPVLTILNTATAAGSGPTLSFGHDQGGGSRAGAIKTYLTDGSTSNRTALLRFHHTQQNADVLKLQLGDNYVRQYQKGDTSDYLETIVNDDHVEFHIASGNYAKISTDHGYLNVGPMNGSHCHFISDIGNFYTTSYWYVNNAITLSSYNQDVEIRRNNASADRINISADYTRIIVNNTERFRATTSGATITGHAYATSSYLAPNGSAGTPAYRFNNDGDTGIYRYGANQLGFATGGTSRGFINSDGNWYNNANFIATNNGTGYAGRDTGGTVTTLIKASTSNFVEVGSSLALKFVTNGSSRYQIDTSGNHSIYGNTSFSSPMTVQYGVIINEGGYDSDTRIEGDTDTNLVRVDAGNDRVGIGIGTPSAKLDVKSQINVTNSSNASMVGLKGTNFGYSTSYKALQIGNTSGTYSIALGYDPSTNASASFTGDGREVIFRNGVEFTTPNAANNGFHNDVVVLKDGKVGLSTASPSYKLDVDGDIRAQNGHVFYGDSTSGVLSTGSWAGDLTSNGWERVAGLSHDGGEFVLVEKNGQVSTLIDGSYFAYEAGTNQGGGFYSSSNSTYGAATGIVASGGTLYVKQADGTNASLYSTGDFTVGSGYINSKDASTNLHLRRGTNDDDRITIEASEQKFIIDATERLSLTSSGAMIDGHCTLRTGKYFTAHNESSYNKYSMYAGNGQYAIGMISSTGFGAVDSWAMTFTFSDETNRGFLWRKNGHSAGQGAMSLNTEGKLNVAHSVRVGYGISDGTAPGATYGLDVSGSIGATADVVAYISSDKRLKDNIKNIANPLDKLNKLNGVEFDWNDKQDLYKGHDIGVIAQEVEEVLPEIVDTREDGHKAVKYDRMVALLIEAVKEQQVQINELKTKLGE